MKANKYYLIGFALLVAVLCLASDWSTKVTAAAFFVGLWGVLSMNLRFSERPSWAQALAVGIAAARGYWYGLIVLREGGQVKFPRFGESKEALTRSYAAAFRLASGKEVKVAYVGYAFSDGSWALNLVLPQEEVLDENVIVFPMWRTHRKQQ